MKTIHRFELAVADESAIEMPLGAVPVSVGPAKNGFPDFVSVWAIVDTEEPLAYAVFQIRGTGHPFDGKEGEFIGTVDNRALVWHVFTTAAGAL